MVWAVRLLVVNTVWSLPAYVDSVTSMTLIPWVPITDHSVHCCDTLCSDFTISRPLLSPPPCWPSGQGTSWDWDLPLQLCFYMLEKSFNCFLYCLWRNSFNNLYWQVSSEHLFCSRPLSRLLEYFSEENWLKPLASWSMRSRMRK